MPLVGLYVCQYVYTNPSKSHYQICSVSCGVCGKSLNIPSTVPWNRYTILCQSQWRLWGLAVRRPRSLRDRGCDLRSESYEAQQFSLVIQRSNVASLMGAFEPSERSFLTILIYKNTESVVNYNID